MGSNLLGASLWLASAASAAPAPELARLDVCAAVPGAEVARAAGGRLLEAKAFQAPDGKLTRCTYQVVPAGAGDEKRVSWVVELLPRGQYEALRPFVDQPVREIARMGDGAFVYTEAESGRLRLYGRRRKGTTVSLTGTDEAILRRIALLVLSRS